MASCVWQHDITRMNVIAYAVGGSDARDRVPDDGRGSNRPQVAVDDPASIGWENSPARWNIGVRDATGKVVPAYPTISPEEDQRRKEIAFGMLNKLRGQVARAGGRAPSAFSKKGEQRRQEAREAAQAAQATHESQQDLWRPESAQSEAERGFLEDLNAAMGNLDDEG